MFPAHSIPKLCNLTHNCHNYVTGFGKTNNNAKKEKFEFLVSNERACSIESNDT